MMAQSRQRLSMPTQKPAPSSRAFAPCAAPRRAGGLSVARWNQPASSWTEIATAAAPVKAAAPDRAVALGAPAAAPAAPAASGALERAIDDGRPTALRNIVFVSSEAAPWSKTGGLGDVVGSLPAALAARGHRVMVVVPRYEDYPDTHDTGVSVELLGHAEVRFFHRRARGVDWVFVDHPSYKRPAGLYADAHGPYGDNQFRFTLLSLAGCEAPLLLPLPPAGAPDGGEAGAASSSGSSSSSTSASNGATSTSSSSNGNGNGNGNGASAPSPSSAEASSAAAVAAAEAAGWSTYGQDITFVANDWHAALVPVYLAAKYRPHGVFGGARSVLAIHNLRHQGVYPPHTFKELGLPPQWYGAVEFQYPPHQRQGSYAEEGRSVNHLKAGIGAADRLVTVSPGYSEEVTTMLGGWGLDGLLGARRPVLNGIVNGIDLEEWDPATDKHLAANYSIQDFKSGKAKNKAALQRELGLPEDPDAPLLAFIGRLDQQKGADLVLQAAPWLMAQGVQLVCLGTGTPDLEAGLRWLESSFPDQARGWVGFNVALSHRITAAADILLMPSRFEPCGLNQLYAMRYGTVPVAHKTGGLKDTVLDFDPFSSPPAGTGWTFEAFESGALIHAAGLALSTMRKHPEDFEGLQRRGMERDSSWEGAARTYEDVFTWAHIDPPYCK